MGNLNQINLIGNVVDEPAIREYQGAKFATFTLAVNEKYKTKEGEVRKTTEYIEIGFAGGIVGVVEGYVHKGSSIFVSGKLRSRQWQDKDGGKHISWSVRGDELQLLGSAPKQTTGAAAAASVANNFPGVEVKAQDNPDNDLPF